MVGGCHVPTGEFGRRVQRGVIQEGDGQRGEHLVVPLLPPFTLSFLSCVPLFVEEYGAVRGAPGLQVPERSGQ